MQLCVRDYGSTVLMPHDAIARFKALSLVAIGNLDRIANSR